MRLSRLLEIVLSLFVLFLVTYIFLSPSLETDVPAKVKPAVRHLPASELLQRFHPMAPYPPTQDWIAVLASTWFSTKMHYYNGPMVCNASGNKLTPWCVFIVCVYVCICM